jgi:polysaccharide export outer membrane protein
MKTKVSNTIRMILGVITVMMLLSSCISQKKVRMLQEKTIKDISANFENSKKTTYKLQVGDHLYIKVNSVDPKTSKVFQSDFPINYTNTYLYLNSYTVNEEGYIHFSFIDKLYVRGLTIEQVRTLMQKSVNEYFKEANVFVKLVDFQVAVLGEVSSPGNFTIDKDQINIFQALGLAGGIKEFGNRKKITLVRQTLQGSEVHYLDLTDNSVLKSEYYYLLPNDILYVEPYSSKSFTFSTFPYSVILSSVSTLLLIFTYLKI